MRRCKNCFNETSKEICEHCGFAGASKEYSHYLKPGTILNNRYTIGMLLGSGGFGNTYLAYDKIMEIKMEIKEYYPKGSII